MKLINSTLLNRSNQASPGLSALAANYNFHDSLMRITTPLECIGTGYNIAYHRHPHTAETCLLLQGKIRVMFYNDMKEETESTN